MALKNTLSRILNKWTLARLWLGASQLAVGTQDGAAVAPANTNFPFALVFDPAPGLNSVPCEYNNYTSQLQNLGSKWVGKPFYDVYAVAGPWSERPAGKPSLEHIGSLVLDSPFTTAMYGDAQLFFRRLFWDTELEHRKRTGETVAKVGSVCHQLRELQAGRRSLVPTVSPTTLLPCECMSAPRRQEKGRRGIVLLPQGSG